MKRSLNTAVTVVAASILMAPSLGQAQTSAAAKSASAGQTSTGRVALYAGEGTELTHYSVDVEGAALSKRGAVTLPANVQYAWPHPSTRYLYVAWSDGGPSSGAPGADIVRRGTQHGVSSFRIDPVSGALLPHGQPVPLPSRPIHLSTDTPGSHLLVAYNDPSGVTVHRINPDGTVASEIKQPPQLDLGIYAHQVRADPSNRMVILVTRGNGPTGNRPEDPGALKIFRYEDGLLSNRVSIAPGGGFNFQPRHLDFHPSRPWVFVSLERQHKLQVYEKLNDETLSPVPLFTKESLTNPDHAPARQNAGTVHVHPNGRFVYQANRAVATDSDGKPVFVGGENSIAVYTINQDTGEPARVQNIDTRGMEPRTFALDGTGRILVAGNQVPVRSGAIGSAVPASLAVFRVRSDGKLEFIRKYDVEVSGGRSLFWMGLVSLPPIGT